MLSLRCASSAAQRLNGVDPQLTGHPQGVVKSSSGEGECKPQSSDRRRLLITGCIGELQPFAVDHHRFPQKTASIGDRKTVAVPSAQDAFDVVRLIRGQRETAIHTAHLGQTARLNQQPTELTHLKETGCPDALRQPNRR